MKISYIAIGAIASVLVINSVMAEKKPETNSNTTVAAKSYVDAMDDLKQNIIPKGGTNENTLGDTVVTYTDTAGTIGERGIYDGGSTYTNNDADKLITAEVVHDFATTLETMSINTQVLTRVNGSGNACSSGDDCNLWLVGDNTQSIAPAGTFAPLTSAAPSCKAYDESYTNVTECCSGATQTDRTGVIYKCGCNTSDDCPNKVATCMTNYKTCVYLDPI